MGIPLAFWQQHMQGMQQRQTFAPSVPGKEAQVFSDEKKAERLGSGPRSPECPLKNPFPGEPDPQTSEFSTSLPHKCQDVGDFLLEESKKHGKHEMICMCRRLLHR
jgi:hypothetical protein